MDIQISIIIVNFNTSDLLADCLKSIVADPHKPPCQIIVVDNNSTDNSQMMVQQNYPQVTLIANTDNKGFAAANNQGLHHATGKYVWLLNPDTLVFPGCLNTLYQFMESHPRCGAVSPRTWLDTDRTLEVCSLKLLNPHRARLLFTRLPNPHKTQQLEAIWKIDSPLWTATKPVSVEGIGGAAFFTNRNWLNSIGGLDERFFMGYEDTDLSAQVAENNKQIYIHNSAEIVHLFGQAKQLKSAPRKITYAWQAAPSQFLQKYFGKSATRWLALLRNIDRLWRRLLPEKPLGQTIETQPIGVQLKWQNPNQTPCILEISNDRIFYDKFGVSVNSDNFTIDAALLNRLQGNQWYWRVWNSESSPRNPLAHGQWNWKKDHDNS